MQTDFFIKKRWIYLGISQLLAAFVLIMLVYAAFLSRAETVWVGKSFYFLVSKTEHIEAGAYDAKLDGGAGYLLEYEGREYVALAVYLNGEDGRAVHAANGEDTKLLQMDIDKLFFKGCSEKKNAPLYQGALDCLYGCMEVLGLEIDRLDDGATQQSAARTLGILLKQLRYLAQEYQTSFASCAKVCASAGERLEALLSDTIYAKDLRYLLCELSTGYMRLASTFSL
jgi:hypothetical protein